MVTVPTDNGAQGYFEMEESTEKQRLANIVRHLVASASGVYGKNKPRVNTSDEDGVRYLHFGTPWIQGAMRLDRPDAIEVEYVQQMMLWTLFMDNPAHICQLGLGAATLTRFCHLHYPQAQITTVEIDQDVIDVCRDKFLLPPNGDRLNVLLGDAMEFVSDPDNHGTLDILQVDLYDADARGPALGSPEFYRACADSLKADGMMTVNLFCDYPEHNDHLLRMEEVFEAVAWLPEVHDSNIVAIGFRQAPVLDFDELYQRADRLTQRLGLPARTWVDGLYSWMERQ